MNVKQIPLKQWEVEAILAGQKTQTRREIKGVGDDNWLKGASNHVVHALDKCPFGQPGDLLYVRETWQGPLLPIEKAEEYWHHGDEKYESPEYCEYAADGGPRPEYIDCDDNLRHGWRPSIHMPRWASRLTLEITDVRVERLQEISEVDAWKDGGFPVPDRLSGQSYRSMFKDLWDSIYSNWSANPWVWVVSFKVHHCNVNALLREREAA